MQYLIQDFIESPSGQPMGVTLSMVGVSLQVSLPGSPPVLLGDRYAIRHLEPVMSLSVFVASLGVNPAHVTSVPELEQLLISKGYSVTKEAANEH